MTFLRAPYLLTRFAIPNYLAPPLLTMSVLCWGGVDWRPVQPFGRGGLADMLSVLSSGVAGAGVPGIGGWASVWSFGPTIVNLETSVHIVIGAVLTYWVFVPCAFFGGLAAWPSSFREFNREGHYYNSSEGHYGESGESVHLSAMGQTMYIGVALSISAMFTYAPHVTPRRPSADSPAAPLTAQRARLSRE